MHMTQFILSPAQVKVSVFFCVDLQAEVDGNYDRRGLDLV